MNKNRMVYIDHIRAFLIILVVMIHVSVTYSGIGGWYYNEVKVDELDLVQKVLFALFNGFTQAYFMGFLFLLAGYFVPAAYDRKGFKEFIYGRLIRLGIPVIIYVFLINPFILFVLLADYFGYSDQSFFRNYLSYLTNFQFLSGTGPLWFAFALLVFSILYACFRLFRFKQLNFRLFSKWSPNLIVILLVLMISCVTFVVRLVFPFGTSFYNFQLCFFIQYIVLFVVGIISNRLNLFNKIRYTFGINWFKYGIPFSLLFFVGLVLLGGAIEGKEALLFGGLYWQAFGYALWENIVCASMVLGLLVLFRDKRNIPTPFSQFLSDQAFGVYVFHAPILIFISLIFKDLMVNPLLKAFFIFIVTTPLVFIFSYFIRKVSVLKKIFS